MHVHVHRARRLDDLTYSSILFPGQRVGDVTMRWPLRSYDGGSQAQLTHNDRDKGGYEAHDLEASRNFPGYRFS